MAYSGSGGVTGRALCDGVRGGVRGVGKEKAWVGDLHRQPLEDERKHAHLHRFVSSYSPSSLSSFQEVEGVCWGGCCTGDRVRCHTMCVCEVAHCSRGTDECPLCGEVVGGGGGDVLMVEIEGASLAIGEGVMVEVGEGVMVEDVMVEVGEGVMVEVGEGVMVVLPADD